MKGFRFLALWIALGALAGCGAAPRQQGEGGLTVCVSFYVMENFVEKIAGDGVTVVNLMAAGGDPHDWEPAARDIALLESADLFVYNGAGFEHWVEGVLDSVQSENLTAVETAAGLAVAQGGRHQEDPHVWLSPVLAGEQMQRIRDALIQADPGGAEEYTARCQQWLEELEELDALYRETLDPMENREIVVSHQAFGYLCGEYGLEQIAVSGIDSEGEPDPARMAEVVELASQREIRVIFFEEAASAKVAEAIAREIGAETAVLNPLETLDPERRETGEDYFSVMRENLRELEAALR